MPSPFGVKGPKVGSCIVVGGVMVARVGMAMNMEEAIVLPGSIKKAIAEIANQ